MLMVLTTHPIQYQVPLWKMISKLTNNKIIIYYITKHGVKESFDPEFRITYKWDFDILNGYKHKFDESAESIIKGFLSHRIKSTKKFIDFIDENNITTIIIGGWNVLYYLQALFLIRIKRPKIKIILRCEANDNGKRNIFIKFIRYYVTKIIVRQFDCYLTIGEDNKKFYINRGISKNLFYSTPYGVDNDGILSSYKFNNSLKRVGFRSKYKIDQDSTVFLFCGKFIPKKNPIHFVEALKLFKNANPNLNVHALFVGDGEMRNILQKITNVTNSPWDMPSPINVNKYNNDLKSSFTGFLNQSEIFSAYDAADFIVLPSNLNETWGLVINEAMLFNVVPIVSDECGCAVDLVKPLSSQLVFKTGDIKDLYRSLDFAVKSPEIRPKVKKLVNKFSLTLSANMIYKIYNNED